MHIPIRPAPDVLSKPSGNLRPFNQYSRSAGKKKEYSLGDRERACRKKRDRYKSGNLSEFYASAAASFSHVFVNKV